MTPTASPHVVEVDAVDEFLDALENDHDRGREYQQRLVMPLTFSTFSCPYGDGGRRGAESGAHAKELR